VITVQFSGYTVYRDTMRQAQMVLSQAARLRVVDLDLLAEWFYAGCPIGRGYAKWFRSR
jgi:hypothetical protein